MDVTCPACNTRYEFDEALVASKGTTVKCTNCGHQFKVFRPDGASGLDGWVVRTTDGRELKFKAMRELQAAITTRKVSREDVLIPGDGAEPRRLGRIEELQSFFSLGEEVAPTTRRRHDTPTSHHDGVSQDLVKTKVRGSETTSESVTRAHPSAVDREGEPLPARSGKTLRPPRDSGRELPPEPKTLPRAEGLPPDVRERFDSEVSGEVPPARRRATKLGRRTPDEVPPDRPTEIRSAGPHASRHGQLDAIDALHRAVRDELGPASDPDAVPPAARPPTEVAFEDVTNPRAERPTDATDDGPLPSDDDTLGDTDAAEAVVARALGPKPRVAPAPPKLPQVAAAADVDVDEDQSVSAGLPSSFAVPDMRISEAPETPTPSAARPSVLRRSDVYSDPRFSGYTTRGKRPTLARWVVGIMAVGLIGVAAFTAVKRLTPTADQVPTAAPGDDGRVDKFLEEGEVRLAEGDVEGAKDHFNKASGVTETDPRVWRALARTEVVRADLAWLELQVLDVEAEGRGSLEQRLTRSVERARSAADRALELAPDDPLTTSIQMDVLRLEGKSTEARKLSPKVDGAGPDADRARALLDLLEAKPNYSSIIDRLRSAARSERKLGRAQSLLVFTLVRADKRDEARKELEALIATSDRHVMVIPLRALLDGEKVAASKEKGDEENGTKPEVKPPVPPVHNPVTVPRPRPHGGHFEFEDEPDLKPHPTPTPDPPEPQDQPAPAPDPTPAPVDTSDLPE